MAKARMICLATLAGIASAAAQTKVLPERLPSPTVFTAPTPAPMAPLINPGPAVVPPAGLSPLLTEPGPVYPTPERAIPAYPSPQFPGPTGQQNVQSNRNDLLDQQWQLERSGVSPGSERSREIQQQLNQPGPR
jgi:hypothetical protein